LHGGAEVKRDPTWDTVQALPAALGVSCEEFVTRSPGGSPAGQGEGESKKPKKGKGEK
jgi:hypothetical protein